ncbi:MAG: GrpB family protein [Desulfobacter sp.]|nr:MAG: GrpB family protein [Desulfobacter sp.]
MTTNLHKLTPAELGRLFPVIITRAQPEWPQIFTREKQRLTRLLKQKICGRIEHVGSTAVPGLAAKPTIDILIEIVDTPANRASIIAAMEDEGYIHMKEQSHLMMVKGYTPAGMEIPSFHIHMGSPGFPKLEEMIRFRDILRADRAAARDYETLKRSLARRYRTDRETYTQAKTDFIRARLAD